MRRNLTLRTAAAGLTLAAAIGTVLALLVVRVDTFRHAARLEAPSSETIAAANHLERTLLDLETGLRGYLVAGDPKFLEPYREAERTYPAETTRLTHLA